MFNGLMNVPYTVFLNCSLFIAACTDFNRVLDEPQYDPMPTVGVRLVSVLSDNTQHVGQALFVRGMLQGFGWRV